VTAGALVLVLGAAFLAGLVDAMVGGGGLVQVPALFGALPASTPPATLLGTSKLAGFVGTASAASRYARTIPIPWRFVAPACAVALLASLAGAATVTHVPPAVFRPLVPVILALVLAYTLARPDLGAQHAPRALGRRQLAGAMLLVAAIGFYDGFFGPGTGTFLIVAFVALLGDGLAHASAGAKVVNFASNLAAVTLFSIKGVVVWRIAVPMAAAQLAGGWIGAHLAVRRGDALVRRTVVLVTLALAVKLAWDMRS
jgi:uncharacterized membrane protein YfcA